MADEPLEKLVIEIKGDNTDAVGKIQGVITALENLNKKFSSKASKNTPADRIRAIGNAIDSINPTKLENLARVLENMPKKAAAAGKSIADAVAKATETPKGGTESANPRTVAAGEDLNRAFEKVYDNVTRIGGAIRNVKLDRLTRESDALQLKLADVRKQMTEIGQDDTKQSKLASLELEAVRLEKRIEDVNAKINEMGNGNGSKSESPLASFLKSQVQSKATGDSQALTALTQSDPELAVTLGLLVKVGQELDKVIKKIAEVGWKVTTFPFKLAHNAISKIINSVGNLIKMAKKRVLYRLLNTLISSVSKGFTDGIQHVYDYSSAISGTFASSMNKIATSALYVKNSIGAMVSPLINALVPAIDYIADKFVDLLNIINQVIATLTGAATWTKAIKYPIEYGDEAKKASGKVKELKKSVLAIDELNQLKDNSNSGSGGKTDLLDYSKMFEEMDNDSPLSQFIQGLKDDIENGNWASVGTKLAEKLNGLIDSVHEKVSWENFGPWISGKIQSAADAFNAFGANVNWTNIGTTISDGLDSVLRTIQTALSKFDILSTATYLTDILNGFTGNEQFWSDLGTTLHNLCTTALGWLKTAIQNYDWEQLGKSLAIGLKDLKMDEILTALQEVSWSLFDGLKSAVNSFIKEGGLKEIGRLIWNGFIRAIANIINVFSPQLADRFYKKFSKPAEGSGANLGESTVEGFKTKLDEPDAATKLKNSYKNLFDRSFTTDTATGKGDSLGTALTTGIGNQLPWSGSTTLLGRFVTWLSATFSSAKASAQGNADGTSLIDSFSLLFPQGGTTSVIAKFVSWMSATFSPSKAKTQGEDVGNSTISGINSKFALTNIATATAAFTAWLSSVFSKNKAESQGKVVADGTVTGITTQLDSKQKDGTITNLIAKLFGKDKGKLAGEEYAKGVVEGLVDKLQKGKVQINTNFSSPMGGKTTLDFDIQKYGFASGGYPLTGQAFIARESGPELVGTIGNRTAVVNNDQIVESVSQGVYEANAEQNALLREQNQILRAILGKDEGGNEFTADAILSVLGQWNRRAGMAVG